MSNAHRARFKIAIDQLRQGPSEAAFSEIMLVYGNASHVFADTVALYNLAMESNGPFLETGSGVTSVILGIVAEKKGSHLYVIEADRMWAKRAESVFKLCGITCATVLCGTPAQCAERLPACGFWLHDGPQNFDIRASAFDELGAAVAKATVIIDDATAVKGWPGWAERTGHNVTKQDRFIIAKRT
jgi:hypothetical protein